MIAALLVSVAFGRPLIGLSINVPEGGGTKELIQAITDERSLGLKLIYISKKWSEIEPTLGVLQMDQLKSDMKGAVDAGFTPVLTFQTIDTNNRVVPSDLKAEPFDSTTMLAREAKVLRALEGALPPTTMAVMLGNEVDIYLAQHPSETAAFARFVRDGRDIMRRLRPTLPIGVTTTFDGQINHPEIVRQVQQTSDIFSATYYPMKPDFTVRPTSDIARDFDSMVAFAGPRKLFVQEAGYPASEVLGSSEERQAEFVRQVFATTRRLQDKIAGVNFFLMVDFNKALMKTFTEYYGSSDARFVAFLGTLGLRRADGTPRQAWSAFESQAKGWK